jgi:hypothetical protein
MRCEMHEAAFRCGDRKSLGAAIPGGLIRRFTGRIERSKRAATNVALAVN